MNYKFRLIVACGGTGGHFYPGLTIARELQSQGGDAMLILSGRHADKQSKIAADYGLNSVVIQSSQIAYSPIKGTRFALSVFRGTCAAIRIMRIFQPDAFLAMGSFTSLPSSLAAKYLKVPIFLHDGNARIGKANRFLSRLANSLMGAYPPVNGNSCHCPITVTGMPIRQELKNAILTKSDSIERLNCQFNANLNPQQLTVLIFGGSQGAASINAIMPKVFEDPALAKIQVLHLTGPGYLEKSPIVYLQNNSLVIDSSELIHLFYQASDLVICRAGGSTIGELAFYGKPAILSPFPFAAEGHQLDNARFYADTGAAQIIEDHLLDVNTVKNAISNVLFDPQNLLKCQELAKTVAMPEAAQNALLHIQKNLK